MYKLPESIFIHVALYRYYVLQYYQTNKGFYTDVDYELKLHFGMLDFFLVFKIKKNHFNYYTTTKDILLESLKGMSFD